MRCFFGLIAMIPLFANATYLSVSGNVEFVRTHSISLLGKEADWIALTGVSELGTCRVEGGYVVFRLASDMDRAYSTALAAQVSSKRLKVTIDDNNKDTSGACWVRWLNIENS